MKHLAFLFFFLQSLSPTVCTSCGNLYRTADALKSAEYKRSREEFAKRFN